MSHRKYVIIDTAAGTRIGVRRLGCTDDRPQGLVLEADHPLVAESTEASRLVLWSDTAPDLASVKTTAAGQLRIWHVWRDGDLIQAWECDAYIDFDDACSRPSVRWVPPDSGGRFRLRAGAPRRSTDRRSG